MGKKSHKKGSSKGKRGRKKRNDIPSDDTEKLFCIASSIGMQVGMLLINSECCEPISTQPTAVTIFRRNKRNEIEELTSPKEHGSSEDRDFDRYVSNRNLRNACYNIWENALRNVNRHVQRWFIDVYIMHMFIKTDRIPWSIAVSFDTYHYTKDMNDINIIFILGASVLTRSLDSIMFVIPHLIKTINNNYTNDDCCWICLEELKCYNVLGPATLSLDYFGCGHNVCTACKKKVETLDRCGVCRSSRQTDSKIKFKIQREARDIMSTNGECLLTKALDRAEEEEEVEKLMTEMGLN